MTDNNLNALNEKIEASEKRKKARKATAGGRPIIANIIRNWLHQGFFYLDKTEMAIRIFIEIAPTVLLAYISTQLLPVNPNNILLWLIVLMIVHTLCWIFNDNWWTCIIQSFPQLTNPGDEMTCRYLNDMKKRLASNDSIAGLLIYGSISRRVWHDRSDLDMRILRKPGFLNAIVAYYTISRERVIAVFKKQPLDIYLADNVAFLKKLRSDETPVILLKNDDLLQNEYPGIPETDMNLSHFENSRVNNENS
jgi:hypothetical protein